MEGSIFLYSEYTLRQDINPKNTKTSLLNIKFIKHEDYGYIR